MCFPATPCLGQVTQAQICDVLRIHATSDKFERYLSSPRLTALGQSASRPTPKPSTHHRHLPTGTVRPSQSQGLSALIRAPILSSQYTYGLDSAPLHVALSKDRHPLASSGSGSGGNDQRSPHAPVAVASSDLHPARCRLTPPAQPAEPDTLILWRLPAGTPHPPRRAG